MEPLPIGDISELIRQKYQIWIQAEFTGSLDRFDLNAVIEHNRESPASDAGEKSSDGDIGDEGTAKHAIATVTYTYQEATRDQPENRTRYDGRPVKYGPIKTVTREIDRIPYSFELDVGGNTPPKMIRLERTFRGRD